MICVASTCMQDDRVRENHEPKFNLLSSEPERERKQWSRHSRVGNFGIVFGAGTVVLSIVFHVTRKASVPALGCGRVDGSFPKSFGCRNPSSMCPTSTCSCGVCRERDDVLRASSAPSAMACAGVPWSVLPT